jgi:hypothetical protein
VAIVSFAASLMSDAPHSGQNFAAAAMGCPQAGQARGGGAPHSAQNLSPSGTVARQVLHSMPHLM